MLSFYHLFLLPRQAVLNQHILTYCTLKNEEIGRFPTRAISKYMACSCHCFQNMFKIADMGCIDEQPRFGCNILARRRYVMPFKIVELFLSKFAVPNYSPLNFCVLLLP